MGQFSRLCLWLGAFRRILYIGVPYSRKKKYLPFHRLLITVTSLYISVQIDL